MINTFTSTGMKLIHHPGVIRNLFHGRASPISLQVAPTSRCNLKCVFCSNANRTKHEDIDYEKLIFLLEDLKSLGLKSVEWTGGGDATVYAMINEVIQIARMKGLEQGMITNGVQLREKLRLHTLKALRWMRISVNALEYVPKLDIPDLPNGTLGFSYVKNEKTTPVVMERIHEHVLKYRPAYVRIVTNCLATDEEQVENNKIYAAQVADYGKPYFYQPKSFERSQNCYWCYIKPFLLHDNYVYPCSSVVLNAGADGRFHEKFRWTRIYTLVEKYQEKVSSFPPDNCNHCVFKSQNDLVDMILNPKMENFV